MTWGELASLVSRCARQECLSCSSASYKPRGRARWSRPLHALAGPWPPSFPSDSPGKAGHVPTLTQQVHPGRRQGRARVPSQSLLPTGPVDSAWLCGISGRQKEPWPSTSLWCDLGQAQPSRSARQEHLPPQQRLLQTAEQREGLGGPASARSAPRPAHWWVGMMTPLSPRGREHGGRQWKVNPRDGSPSPQPCSPYPLVHGRSWAGVLFSPTGGRVTCGHSADRHLGVALALGALHAHKLHVVVLVEAKRHLLCHAGSHAHLGAGGAA